MEKKKKFESIKIILFGYLALSKVIYWFDIISGAGQGDFWGITEAFLTRFMQRDLILIIFVIFFFLLEKMVLKKSKGSKIINSVIVYSIGYIGVICLFYIYTWVMSWFFPVDFPPLMSLIGETILGYIAISITLEMKIFFKTKKEETYKATSSVHDTEDKVSMLKTLFDSGVLTQEEFDTKKDLLVKDTGGA